MMPIMGWWTQSYGSPRSRIPIWVQGRGERRAYRRRLRKRIRVGDLITWGYGRSAHEVLEISPQYITVEPGHLVYWAQPKIHPRSTYFGNPNAAGACGQIVRVAKGSNWRNQSSADRKAVAAARAAAEKRDREALERRQTCLPPLPPITP